MMTWTNQNQVFNIDPTTTTSPPYIPHFLASQFQYLLIFSLAIALSTPPTGEVLRPLPPRSHTTKSTTTGAVFAPMQPLSMSVISQSHPPPLQPPAPPQEQNQDQDEELPYQPPPPPPPRAVQQKLPGPSLSLYKQHSWSPDIYRDEAWLRRKGNSKKKKSKSVTDEDVDELKACIELGFGFDSPEMDQRLSHTLPALGLYYAVNKHYYDHAVSSNKSVTAATTSSSSTASDCDSLSPLDSPHGAHAIFGPGDNPQTVKTRLRQWAQVVACSVRQSSNSSSS